MADRIADERSPLIERDSEAAQPEQSVDDATKTIAAPSPEKKRSWWQIGWYTILWLSALFVAVVFVKGFIDADDVEVCPQLVSLGSSPDTCSTHEILSRFWVSCIEGGS